MDGSITSFFGPILFGGAFVVTQLVALRLVDRAGLDTKTAFWATVFGTAGALLGGALWSAVEFQRADASVLELLVTGERAVLGAVLGAASAGLIWLALQRRQVLAYADAMVPAVFLGYAIARLACLVEGHCFGAVTDLPLGITYPPGSSAYLNAVAAGWIEPDAPRSPPVHPSQLYHAAVGLLGFVLLMRVDIARPGTRIALALLGYGVARFCIQFLRNDWLPVLGALDATQMTCLVMVLTGVAMLLLRPSAVPDIARGQPTW